MWKVSGSGCTNKKGFLPGIQIVSKSLSQKLSSGAKVWSRLFQQVGFPSQGTASIITMAKERLAFTDSSLWWTDWHRWVASFGVSPFSLYFSKQSTSSSPLSQTGCWSQRLVFLKQVSTPFTFKKLWSNLVLAEVNSRQLFGKFSIEIVIWPKRPLFHCLCEKSATKEKGKTFFQLIQQN